MSWYTAAVACLAVGSFRQMFQLLRLEERLTFKIAAQMQRAWCPPEGRSKRGCKC